MSRVTALLFLLSLPLTIALRVDNAQAQSAYGPSCLGTIDWKGAPVLGSSEFQIHLKGGVPSQLATLMIGFSDSDWAGIPLPLDLAVFGAPGCALLTEPSIQIATQADLTGLAIAPTKIPWSPSLLGIPIFAQWYSIDPISSPLGLVFSDGLRIVPKTGFLGDNWGVRVFQVPGTQVLAWSWALSDGRILFNAKDYSFWSGFDAQWACVVSGDGVIDWQKHYVGTGETSLEVHDNSGTLWVSGTTDNIGAGGKDLFIGNLDSNGLPNPQWTLGGSGDESVNRSLWTNHGSTTHDTGTVLTSDGGSMFVGVSDSFGSSGENDMIAIKLQGDNSLDWQLRLDGGPLGYGLQHFETMDGGHIFLATTPFGKGLSDIWVVKVDMDGVVLWQKAYGGSGGHASSWPKSWELPNGGIMILASIDDALTSNSMEDSMLMELDSSGDIVWQRVFGGDSDDQTKKVMQLPDGGWIAFGQTDSYSTTLGDADMWLVKLSASGQVNWQKTYDGDYGNALPSSISLLGDGGFLLHGQKTDTVTGAFLPLYIRVNSSGQILWQRVISAPGYAASVLTQVMLSTGDMLVSGALGSSSQQGMLWLLKLDLGNGSIAWQRMWDSSLSSYLSIAYWETLSNGDKIAYGQISTGSGDTDALLVRVSEAGVLLWSNSFGGSGDDRFGYIKELPTGLLVASGITDSFGSTDPDPWFLQITSAGDVAGTCPSGLISMAPGLGSLLKSTSTQSTAKTQFGSGSNSKMKITNTSRVYQGTLIQQSTSWLPVDLPNLPSSICF